ALRADPPARAPERPPSVERADAAAGRLAARLRPAPLRALGVAPAVFVAMDAPRGLGSNDKPPIAPTSQAADSGPAATPPGCAGRTHACTLASLLDDRH